MINLKVNGEVVESKLNYAFYKNLTGSADESKFEDFLERLMDSDIDVLIPIYSALCAHKLSNDEIFNQLEQNDVFDDPEKEFSSLLDSLQDSGFFSFKIKKWYQDQQTIVKAIKDASNDTAEQLSSTKSGKLSEEQVATLTAVKSYMESELIKVEKRNKKIKKMLKERGLI